MTENETTEYLSRLRDLAQNQTPAFNAWLRRRLLELLEAEPELDPRGRVSHFPATASATATVSSLPLGAGLNHSGVKQNESSTVSPGETQTPSMREVHPMDSSNSATVDRVGRVGFALTGTPKPPTSGPTPSRTPVSPGSSTSAPGAGAHGTASLIDEDDYLRETFEMAAIPKDIIDKGIDIARSKTLAEMAVDLEAALPPDPDCMCGHEWIEHGPMDGDERFSLSCHKLVRGGYGVCVCLMYECETAYNPPPVAPDCMCGHRYDQHFLEGVTKSCVATVGDGVDDCNRYRPVGEA